MYIHIYRLKDKIDWSIEWFFMTVTYIVYI